MKKVTVIVAGGSGIRMGSLIPKQFLVINGLPVLMHTIRIFHQYDAEMPLILILPDQQLLTWQNLCDEYHFHIPLKIGTGGETRFHTVKKNLDMVPDDVFVAIHDGVRPLVSIDTIERCFREAAESGNAVPCVEIPETLRMIEKNGNRPADRSLFRLIQTPQVFHAREIKRAYNQDYRPAFTDDASVLESTGIQIHLVPGNAENIKITIERDIIVAGALLKHRKT